MKSTTTFKVGSHSAVGQTKNDTGTVIEVGADGTALVRMRSGSTERVSVYFMRAKGSYPAPGETWLFDRELATGWQFACLLSVVADLTVQQPGSLENSWAAVSGPPDMPVGWIKTADGYVTLQGKVSGGTAPSVAFTLPDGYRPGGTYDLAVPGGSGFAQVSIAATGDLTVVSGTGPVSLDGVRFPVMASS